MTTPTLHTAHLPARTLIRLTGEPARDFLQALVTNDLRKLNPGEAGYGALLTPQGKVLVDFLVSLPSVSGSFSISAGQGGGRFPFPAGQGGGLLLDCPASEAETLVALLTRYRLRAKVGIALIATAKIFALWGDAPLPANAVKDLRHPALGHRLYVPENETPPLVTATPEDYRAHRLACAVPEGGADFAYGDVFPHDINMDRTGGVAFDKGCFIGQEVVSRMQHRGTARTRILPVAFAADTLPQGAEIMANGRPIGQMGSSFAGHGLAKLRIDRVEEALAAGQPVTADGQVLTVTIPA